MNVLHIIPSADPRFGGPIEGILRLDEVMRERGVQQSLLTLDSPDLAAALALPINIHALGKPLRQGKGLLDRFLNWANYTPQALAWGREHLHEFDAVVCHSLWNYGARLARQLLVGSNTPYVVYPHGMLDPWFRRAYPAKHLFKQGLWLFNEGVLLRHADAVLFTCEQERVLAAQTFWPYRVRERVVAFGAGEPPPPDPQHIADFRRLVPGLGERRFILYLSRIHPKKGCDLLIEAFGKVANDAPDVDLVMVGPDETGMSLALRQRADQLGIGNRIHWPGMIQGPPKFGAYRAAEAFILPSHMENFGIVVAEAMACECPVLISNQVQIWREIEAAGAGLVEADTLAGTEALLRRFLALGPAGRQAMGTRGRAAYLERFNIQAAGEELIAILESISGKR